MPLRIVFYGTPAFAVPTLDALIASQHRVVGVVTQPDRPRGRGQKVSYAPVKARALEADIRVLQPDRLKAPEFLEDLARLGADLGVVAAYGKLLPDPVLAMPRLGLINVHASLLPRYRGAAPIHRAVMAGDTETGVTIMRVVKALDAGPMLALTACPIGPDETSEAVEARMAVEGARLLLTVVDAMADGPVPEIGQDEAQATYAHRISREDGVINWSRSARDIHNQVRGLTPWPHAFTWLDGQRLLVRRARVEAATAAAPPGTVLEASAGRLLVSTGEGTLEVLELQAEGKRPLAAREFLAGRRLAPGTTFTAAGA